MDSESCSHPIEQERGVGYHPGRVWNMPLLNVTLFAELNSLIYPMPYCSQLREGIISKENPWGYAKRLKFIIATISRHFPALNVRVLDVGCGNGSQVAIPLARFGYNVVGIDPDFTSIENARRDCPPTATFHCCFLSSFVERNFEVVILSEVLEHLHEPEKLLQDAIKYVAPDGILIITIPNGVGEFELDKYVFSKLKLEAVIEPFRRRRASVASTENHDGHVQFFRISRLKRMFQESGLSIIANGSGPLACGPLAAYAFNYLPAWAITLNSKITDYLPMQLASGWYFALKPTSRPHRFI